MMVKFNLWQGWWLCLMMLALLGCKAVKDIPDTDIVFQKINKDMFGFINADGTGEQYVEIPAPGVPIAPMTTFNNRYLFFFDAYPDRLSVGYLSAITPNSQLKRYEPFSARGAAPALEDNHIILSNTSLAKQPGLHLFNLETGSIVHTFYKVKKGEEIDVGTNAISDSTLVFVHYPQEAPPEMVVLDTKDGSEKVILTGEKVEGGGKQLSLMYPAISPDGQWIAYTAKDGIYIMDIEGQNQKKFAEICLFCGEGPESLREFAYWPPAVSWSPDSQWIVYHRCTLPVPQKCKTDIKDYTIFKANIETGEESPYFRED
jgi:hypothetical protein